MIYHPSPAVLCLEVAPPITRQDHRKLPSVGTIVTRFVDGRWSWCVIWSKWSMMQGESARRCGDGRRDRDECITCETKSWTSEKLETESQAPALKEGLDGKRRDEAFAPALLQNTRFCYHTCVGCRPIRLVCSGFTFQHCCQVVILLPINTPLICCSVLTISTILLSFQNYCKWVKIVKKKKPFIYFLI